MVAGFALKHVEGRMSEEGKDLLGDTFWNREDGAEKKGLESPNEICNT